MCWFLRGDGPCQDRVLGAVGKSGQGPPPHRPSQRGEWERAHCEDAPFRDPVACLRHGSLPVWHSALPLAPLLSALDPARRPAARWGPSFWWGAAISAAISDGPSRPTQSPHSDGYALPRCQSVLLSLPITMFPPSALIPQRAARSSSFYAAVCWLLRSGSYTSPLTHRRCNSTASFRATAITARFLAFFPPRSQIRGPNRRKSLSGPCGPKM